MFQCLFTAAERKLGGNDQTGIGNTACVCEREKQAGRQADWQIHATQPFLKGFSNMVCCDLCVNSIFLFFRQLTNGIKFRLQTEIKKPYYHEHKNNIII